MAKVETNDKRIKELKTKIEAKLNNPEVIDRDFRDEDGNKWFGRDFFEIKEANPNESVISDSESCSIESGPVTKFEFNTRNIFKNKTFNIKV